MVGVRNKRAIKGTINIRDQRTRLLTDQTTQFALVSPQGYVNKSSCFIFKVQRSLFDSVIEISTYQGDQIAWSVFQISDGNERRLDDYAEELLVRTDQAYSHSIIIRSDDRWRNGQPPLNNFLYFCPKAVSSGMPSSLLFSSYARDYQKRFEAKDNRLFSFVLSTKDYVYFVYQNEKLEFED